MRELIKKSLSVVVAVLVFINLSLPMYAEAKASAEAMDFLRGTWVTYEKFCFVI
ncbi:MAG: hypothetical protein IJ679_07945 [Lachnospiraceae bacterium]|nr:hypothetical protein [Lachnospiraceae bacterium]